MSRDSRTVTRDRAPHAVQGLAQGPWELWHESKRLGRLPKIVYGGGDAAICHRTTGSNDEECIVRSTGTRSTHEHWQQWCRKAAPNAVYKQPLEARILIQKLAFSFPPCGGRMLRARHFLAFLIILASTIFLTNCASTSNSNSSNGGKGTGTTSGSGSSASGAGSSSSGSGSGSSGNAGSGSSSSGAGSGGSGQSAPGFGVGTGASGQNTAARFLYANPLPGGGPYAAVVQSNGTLKATQQGSANTLNPMTMAIDSSGTFLFQTTQETSGSTQVGVFVYKIDRTTGSPGVSVDSFTAGVPFYSDVVDQQGKFLYAFGGQGVYAFSIDPSTGTLTALAGSPFVASTPSSPGYAQPATLMAIDQTNKYLYVSTSKGIYAYSIDQTAGTLTAITGSPFGAAVTGSWAIAVTPTNSYLYQLQASSSASIYAYSVNQTSGVLTPVSGSPFNAGTCGTVVPAGTVGVPGPDNMTIASAGKFMYDNCGIYSINESTGAIAQVSNQGPGDWPVIDPTGDFLWAITGDQTSCFHCDQGVTTYSVNPTTGMLTPVPNSFLFLTNSEVGAVDSLAITK